MDCASEGLCALGSACLSPTCRLLHPCAGCMQSLPASDFGVEFNDMREGMCARCSSQFRFDQDTAQIPSFEATPQAIPVSSFADVPSTLSSLPDSINVKQESVSGTSNSNGSLISAPNASQS